MGGDLTVSRPDESGLGALLKLDIPVGLTDAADLTGLERPVRSRAIELKPGQPVYRLLVAEDRKENRQLLVTLLTSWGFDVRAAANGLEAIRIWQTWQPHLIWMDMRMPVMDGHEATRRIKATPQGRSTIIIALTASAFEEERELVLAEGCDDYVRKPFRQDEIADKLARRLGAQFLYEGEASRQVEPGQSQGALDLAGLPAQELSDLKQAALEADAGKIMRLADRIREQNPVLALALADAVNRFDYAAILSAIQER